VLRRFALPAAAATLGVLLALLAFLQYRWLGQVSDGERQRMRATLEARARDFAADFDGELSRAAAAFLPGSGLETVRNAPSAVPDQNAAFDPRTARALADCWDRWQATAANPKLVRDILVVDRSAPTLALRRFDPASRQLVAADWPQPFRATRDRWAAAFAAGQTAPSPGTSAAPGQALQHIATRVFLDDLSDVPALVVPTQPDILRITAGTAAVATRQTESSAGQPPSAAPHVTGAIPAPPVAIEGGLDIRQGTGGSVVVSHAPASQPSQDAVVLWLDLDEIQRVLLPSLAKKYFSSDEVFDYQVTVLSRRDPGRVFFETSEAAGSATRRHPRSEGDASVPMFRVRLAEVFGRIADSAAPPGSAVAPSATAGGAVAQTQNRYAVSVMRFEATRQTPARSAAVVALADGSGGWLLRLVHRAGSLDAAVERLRRRNLAISSTILGLLAVSLAFVLVSTRRAQRLAAQQVEFVASVSHELRTPLAVIRSAGENLADGVVESPDQVRRYGSLVAEEGRKLGAMVEQVMEYAGMQTDHPRWQKAVVDLPAVVDEAVAGARRLPEARGVSIEVQADAGLPPIEGDRAALVRAVQNLVENAVKYGQTHQSTVDSREPNVGSRSWVGVRVTADGAEEGFGPAASRQPPAASRGWILIEVRDHGPGIDAAERRRIFEPFVRGRAATAARVAGNGLGLSIVRRVAEGHGGRVDVVGNAPTGATFRMTLPRSDPRQNAERRT
jgi:two-component system, OmpR family, sensor histidine kinase SenX3